MFQSSQDLLNVVLAFSILWVAIFLSMVLFYVILTLREAHSVIHEMRERANRMQRAVEGLCNKLEKSAAFVPLIFEGIKEAAKYIMEKREDRKNKRK